MATVEIFDPATGAWTKADPMRYARYGAIAVTLADGRILVAGTEHGDDPPAPAAAPPAILRGPEAFDTERTA